MPKNGGKRPGAGRPRGVPNKHTGAATLRERILASGQTPLQFLVELYRSPMPKRNEGESALTYLKRLDCWDRNRVIGAKESAPYLHSKLSSIELTGKDGDAIKHQHRVELVFVEPERKK
jgi:hypothetical protein